VVRLAWPLVLSNSFWTLQLALDRIILGWQSSEAVGAVMAAGILFWTPQCLFQFTANYATTFVAQYVGAGQPHRVGPVVWQALYFSALGGAIFLALVPFAGTIVSLTGHATELQELEAIYFRTLCFASFPTLVTAAANSFFTGRGQSRIILIVNAVGLGVTAPLAYAWIRGEWGFPALGIEGAGWASVCGASASALVSLGLMLRKRHRKAFATASGWRFDPALFRRLMRFGLPNGLQVALDCLGFSAFLILVGRIGPVELAATSMAFTINMLVFLPTMGIGQAVEVLVGQRLGEDRPDVAERTAWTALRVGLIFMGTVGIAYVAWPEGLADLFKSDKDLEHWDQVRPLVPVLLRFVAVYSLFDCMNLVFSFALRGAGDTRFVTLVSLVLAWPVMVLPTWAACYFSWGLYWAWTFASAYIMALAVVFLLRFRQGKWRTMRVIETVPVIEKSENGTARQIVERFEVRGKTEPCLGESGKELMTDRRPISQGMTTDLHRHPDANYKGA
jgi:MATE family multidrug resistance protein